MILIPSVTEVIGFVNARALLDIPPERLAVAQDRGIDFHALAAAHARGSFIAEVPENCVGRFKSFTKWFDYFVQKVVLIEQPLVHPTLHYCGTPDFVGQLLGDQGNTLIDYKTPLAFSKGWRLQIAAYRELCIVNGIPIERVATLQPHPGGGRTIFKDDPERVNNDFNYFVYALNLWRYFNEN